MVRDNEKPPSCKDFSENIVGVGATDISLDDIKGKQGMGSFWNRFKQPIFYPPGGSLCSRCCSVLMDISGD